MYHAQLLAISERIITSATSGEEIQCAKQLSDFFAQFNLENDETQLQKKTETIIQGGVALSFAEAAVCLNDYLRTVRFIKGTYFAIEELKEKFPTEKLNILYAGCGPYAPILLPVLSLLNNDDFDIVLLDINECSTISVKELLAKLNFTNYSIEVICGNAITYKQPKLKPLHLVITETMFRALISEPQASITANLAPQIIEGGLLIPQEIKLSLGYSFFAKEPFLQNGDAVFDTLIEKAPQAYNKQVKVDTLFSMNKCYNFFDAVHYNTFKFESPLYEIPKDFANYPDVCIYTDILIFKNIKLGLAESYITNPYCVASLFNFTNHTHFKLIYTFKEIPNWTYQLK